MRARSGHAPLSYCPEEEDDREGAGGLGRPGGGGEAGPAGGLHGWHQVSPSLSFISILVTVFYFL